MTITSIRKVNQYLEITDSGHSYRMAVDWADCIVSAIMSGRLKVLNVYRSSANDKFYATYEDATGEQQTVVLSGGFSDLSDIDLTGLSDGYILYYDLATLTWKVKAESPGVTDHGALTGLADDDHAQYELESNVAADAVTAMGVKGGSNPLNHDRYTDIEAVAAAKSDADVASAISLKHTQGTDQGLDTGGVNAVVVADVKDAVDKKHAQLHSNSDHTDLANDPATTTGLTYGFKAGRVTYGLTVDDIAAGTVVLADNSDSYIYVDFATNSVKASTNPNVLTVNTLLIGGATTVAGAITVLYDFRSWLTGGRLKKSDIVSDVAYGVGWDEDTTNAPSKNAVYDKIESLPLLTDLDGGIASEVYGGVASSPIDGGVASSF